jgi:hypothetical protein
MHGHFDLKKSHFDSRNRVPDAQAKPSCACHAIVEINGSVPPTSNSCFAKTYISLYTATNTLIVVVENHLTYTPLL